MVPPLQSPLPSCQNLSLSPIHPQTQTTSGEPLQSRRCIVQTDGSPSHRLTPSTRDSASLSHNLRVIKPNTTKKSGQQTRVKSTINIQDKNNNTFISRSRPLFPLFQDRRLPSLVRKERKAQPQRHTIDLYLKTSQHIVISTSSPLSYHHLTQPLVPQDLTYPHRATIVSWLPNQI